MKNLVPRTLNEFIATSLAIAAVLAYAHTWWQM